MRMRDFIRENREELEAAVNGAMYRHDGNGGAGTVPTPAPTYTADELEDWIANDEGLYLWARREGVRV